MKAKGQKGSRNKDKTNEPAFLYVFSSIQNWLVQSYTGKQEKGKICAIFSLDLDFLVHLLSISLWMSTLICLLIRMNPFIAYVRESLLVTWLDAIMKM